MGYIIVILLSIFAGIFGMLLKFYENIPEKELKRRIDRGKNSEQLRYEILLSRDTALFYLRFLIVGFASAWLLMVSIYFEGIFVILMGLVSSLIFIILIKYRPFVAKINDFIAPIYLKIIVKTRPYVGNLAKFVNNFLAPSSEHKIYELEDLVDLIEAQRVKKINRIDLSKLNLAVNALSFGDRTVSEIMTDKKMIRFVDGEETISAILIDELHQTGFRYFPVYKDTKNNLTGILDLNDLIEKRMSGKVAWASSTEINELSIDNNLKEVLAKFLKTKQLFYIVKKDQKIKGVLEISAVLKALLG